MTEWPAEGWYPDPYGTHAQRYWDGERWTAPAGPLAPIQAAPPKRSVWPSLAIGAVLVVGFLWFNGALDKPLSEVGLNREDCIQNAFGAKYCGDAAKDYCESVKEIAPSDDCEEILRK